MTRLPDLASITTMTDGLGIVTIMLVLAGCVLAWVWIDRSDSYMSNKYRPSPRAHAQARRIARLAADGSTSNEIAALVGIDVGRVKTLRELGDRLIAIKEVGP